MKVELFVKQKNRHNINYEVDYKVIFFTEFNIELNLSISGAYFKITNLNKLR